MLAKMFDLCKIKLFLLNLIVCLAGITSVAQKVNKPDQYRPVLWTIEEGLNYNDGNVMLKDAQGFLWIGGFAGELTRFDGARFNRFMPDPKKPGAINAGRVTAFVEDSLHNIWIATERGLSRYDIQTDLFTNFLAEIDSTTSDRLGPPPIIPFGSTKTHIYCFESRTRIVTFDIRSLEKKTVLTSSQPFDIHNVFFVLLSAILDSKSNSVWLLYSSPEKDVNGLIQISLNDGKQTIYLWPVIYPGRAQFVQSMKLDRKRNSIWINTTSGLLEFSLKLKQFRFIDVLDEITRSKDYDRYGGIDIDKDGKVWFATKPHGIFIYDPETNQAHKLFSDPKLQKDVSEHSLQLYIDRDGIVWSSYYMAKGIYELIPHSPSVKTYSSGSTNNSLSHSTVTAIIPGAQGKMWIGTLDGLNIFDPLTEKFEILREKDFKGLKGKVFAPLFVDTTTQRAWISAGTQSNYWNMKVYEVDLKNMNAYPVNFRNGNKQLDGPSYDPNFVKPFKGKYLIAEDNYGIFELKPGSRDAELVIPFAAPKSRFIIGDGILFCQEALVTGQNSTFKFTSEKTWTRIPHVFDTLQWTDLRYDSLNRTYWVCMKNEISLYDEDFNKINTFELKQDEKPNGVIAATQTDRSGNLWFANMLRQVGKVNASTGSVYFLSEVDGYQKQYFDIFAPSSQDSRGNIYFGSGTYNGAISADSLGLTKVQPGNESSANPARIYLRTVKVNNQEYPLSISVNNLQELSMRHNENNITLEAGIIDYYARGAGRLRFKLEGDDIQHEWVYIGPDQPIRLENLEPGSYKLLVQASTIGTEMMSPEKVLSITIAKPYWQTWAFRILVAIVFITIIYAIIQYRSRSLRRQNVLLEEKITMRTNDLKHSLDELKATQAQLIQSEKMASLGQLTAGIAHEIQNPLNFVKNFSEVIQELIDEMTEEIEKGNLTEAKELSANVKENVQKVLHHGKRADGIVKGMLQHSRSSNGIKEPTSINNLADEYLRLAFHGLRAKDKTFNAAIDTNFDNSAGMINVIPQDIGRVILNLITNAFYAVTEKKKSLGDAYEPRVTVTTKKANGKIEISVKDNGNGIPQSIIEKIFQPFFTTKPTGEGTGLGLSLSYDIITAHSGELKVDTKEGEWTNFRIILPVV